MSADSSGINAHAGLVRMNDFAGLATWDGGGSDSVVIKFNGEVLTSEKLAQLNNLRTLNRPVTMQFPGCAERQAMIVGFGAKDNTVYLTWM
ncbi:hypothetical protein ETAA8_11560 [Anatilimnocola aggregata]|uniref:Uncharacterized protein n=1 Tax=Anatilimnocola aggregata TaxID=2528021 RepID=A0A517Y7G5_9BACT|nr:hypothetical protein [Anatilimnocola aggregata]QDU26082.1 hypothetical protein ETAA8_11560 [Anatilimnocola aggregata]